MLANGAQEHMFNRTGKAWAPAARQIVSPFVEMDVIGGHELAAVGLRKLNAGGAHLALLSLPNFDYAIHANL